MRPLKTILIHSIVQIAINIQNWIAAAVTNLGVISPFLSPVTAADDDFNPGFLVTNIAFWSIETNAFIRHYDAITGHNKHLAKSGRGNARLQNGGAERLFKRSFPDRTNQAFLRRDVDYLKVMNST